MTKEEFDALKPGTRVLSQNIVGGPHVRPGTARKLRDGDGGLTFVPDDGRGSYPMVTPETYILVSFAYYVVKNRNGGYSALFKKLATAQEHAQDGSEILGVTLSPVSKCSKTFTKAG